MFLININFHCISFPNCNLNNSLSVVIYKRTRKGIRKCPIYDTYRYHNWYLAVVDGDDNTVCNFLKFSFPDS